jgi:hypothetical protein
MQQILIKTALGGAMLLALAVPSPAQLVIHQAVELEVATEVNKFYQTQVSADLGSWKNFGDEIVGTGSPVFRFVSTHGKSKEFYRVHTSATSTQVTIDIPSYANLCGRWDYRNSSGALVYGWTVKAQGTAEENGIPIYRLQEMDEHGYYNDQEYYDTDLSKSLLQTGGLNDYGTPTEEKWFWQPFVPKLMKTFIPGAEYTTLHTRTDMSGTSLEMRMRTVEDTISVPFGNNIKCYKVTRTILFDGVEYVFHAWYAKHLGIVKRIEEDGTIWELVSYQP